MTIYRGPGGTGEARTDTDVTEVRIIADEAEGYKDQAATSASAAASSASAAATAETNAETAEANAETAEANAEAAQAAAEAAQAAAEAAQTAAEAAQTAAELAETNAETAEANAETAEANAETAQAAAATSATNAAASASTATTQASNAASSASTATTQAGIATTKASEAASSATAAQSAQTAAESARDSALSAYDNFDDRYLGPKSSDPTLDNDGNALLTGALYYDTTSSVMKVYTGSSWVAAYVSAAGVLLAANNLSDLVSVSTARTNLGLGTAALVADSGLVHTTGNETIGGTKTFSSTITGSITGNAGTVTNGVYTTGSYADPSWITSLAGSKVSGNISGNAATATTATNLSGGTVSATSISDSGNLTFTGTGNRITGDMSNATVASRVTFQTSTTNGSTIVGAIPNGTGVTSVFRAFNAADPTNAGQATFGLNATDVFINSGITGTGTYLPMTFSTGGSERMRVDTSGNLGIGTSSPATKLNVIGDIQLSRSATASDAALNFGSNANNYIYSGNANNLMAFATNGSERIRITSGGDVGIGTSSPGTKLQVNGQTRISDGTTNIDIVCASTVGYMGTQTNAPLVLRTNDTERARIDSSGNLLVGTTSAYGGITSSAGVWKFAGFDAGTSNGLMRHFAASATRIEIYGNGNVANSNGVYGSFSDLKLKENIVDATPKLEKINQVRVVNYNLKGDAQKQIGVIAQELEQIFPSMVDESPDRDEQGNDLGTTTKSVKYSVFVPMLIKAIQEQQAIILAQQTALTALTARVAALESN